MVINHTGCLFLTRTPQKIHKYGKFLNLRGGEISFFFGDSLKGGWGPARVSESQKLQVSSIQASGTKESSISPPTRSVYEGRAVSGRNPDDPRMLTQVSYGDLSSTYFSALPGFIGVWYIIHTSGWP